MLDNFIATIDVVYHKLPQETMIATLLDPRYGNILRVFSMFICRFKKLSHVPAEEREEAMNCLRTEFYSPIYFGLHNELEEKNKEGQLKRKRNDNDKFDIFDMFESDQQEMNENLSSSQENELKRYLLLLFSRLNFFRPLILCF